MEKVTSPRMDGIKRPWPKSVCRQVMSKTLGAKGVTWKASRARTRLKVTGRRGRA